MGEATLQAIAILMYHNVVDPAEDQVNADAVYDLS